MLSSQHQGKQSLHPNNNNNNNNNKLMELINNINSSGTRVVV
jgi:hypothetical protein